MKAPNDNSMDKNRFDSKDECVARLRALLNLDPTAGKMSADLVEAFARGCEVPPDPHAPAPIFGMRIGCWIVRDDDLKLFGSIKDAILPFAAAGFVLGSITAGGAVAIAFAVLQIARNARYYGVELSVRQLQIVTALENAKRRLPKESLLAALPSNWSLEELEVELAALKGLQNRNGTVKVIDQLGDGHIILNGV